MRALNTTASGIRRTTIARFICTFLRSISAFITTTTRSPSSRTTLRTSLRPFSPRHASWLPSNSNFGCEPFSSASSNLYYYRDASPWPPFSYSPTPSPHLSVSIRHYQDPFIVAASITNGCSAATESAASCFGRSIEEDRLIALVLIAIGVVGLTAGITVRLEVWDEG